MKEPGTHPLEAARLETISDLELNAGSVEDSYDAIVAMLAGALDTPICLLSVIDCKRQFFKSNIGLTIYETPREISFCGHAILRPEPLMVVEDAQQDPRFADNPLVIGVPKIRFYAGAVINAPNNLPVGTICAIDTRPRTLTDGDRQHLMRAKLLMESAISLRALSLRDHLTGLYNRRHFDAYFESEWRRAYRHALPLSILLFDIDHFKVYNDRFGHQAGDDCLRRIAQAASGVLSRAGDLLARYGGEEFVAVLPGTSGDAAHQVGDRIRSVIRDLAIESPGAPGSVVTVSVGGSVAAEVAHLARGPTALLGLADEGLYAAKASGRDRTVMRGYPGPDGLPSLVAVR